MLVENPEGGGLPTSTTTRLFSACSRSKPLSGACAGARPRVSDRVSTRSMMTPSPAKGSLNSASRRSPWRNRRSIGAIRPIASWTAPGVSIWATRSLTVRMSTRSCTARSWVDGLRDRWPPSGWICAGISRSSDLSALVSRPAEPPSATSPTIRPFSARSRAAPSSSHAAVRAKAAQLGGEARQHRAAQRRVTIAPGEIVEMGDPGEQPGRQYVGTPGDRVPGDLLGEPAPNQLARCVAGGGPGRDQIREPAEAVPGGKPIGPRRGREPARRRLAKQLAGKLDVADGERRAALRIARQACPSFSPRSAGTLPIRVWR